MIKKPGLLLIIFGLAFFSKSVAQDSTANHAQDSAAKKRFHIAIFTPLYLDSAFDQSATYRYGSNFPKFINAGLEFYEGVQLAIDSLEKENFPLDVYLYDSRANGGITSVLKTNLLDSIDLVIGHVNASEVRQLANASARLKIPFINATYPNDGGITNNPYFIILNSTLYTHCTAMYKFIQKNYPLAPVVLFRKKGVQEDKLMDYFNQISKTTSSVPLKIKIVTLENNFTADDIKKYLGQNGTTVCISGSLDVDFGEKLTQNLASLYTVHPSVVFAMPTWWDATNFSNPEFKGVEVFYSTPFYLSPAYKPIAIIQNIFKTKFYSRPTDMVFRGYETLYHFAHLLELTDKNFGSSLGDKRFRVFTDFDIQPVLNPKTTTLDYFENKKIYFVKKVDGAVTMIY